MASEAPLPAAKPREAPRGFASETETQRNPAKPREAEAPRGFAGLRGVKPRGVSLRGFGASLAKPQRNPAKPAGIKAAAQPELKGMKQPN